MNARLKQVLNVALFLSTLFSVLSVLVFGGYIITRLLNIAISSGGRRNLVTVGTDVAIVAQAFQFLAILLVIITWLTTKRMPKTRHEIIVLGLSLIPFFPALIFIVVSLLYLRARLFKHSSERLKEAVKVEWGGAIDGLQNVVSNVGQNQPGNPLGAGNVVPPSAAGGVNPLPPVPSAAQARVGPIIQSVVGPVTADSLSKAPLGLLSAMVTATILSLTVGGALALNAIPFPPPDVRGDYVGFITNQTFNTRTTWAITVQERNGALSGKVTIDPPLYGTGPLTGAITRDGHVTFTAAGISYIGATQSGGALSGTYTVGNSQHGVWTLHPRGTVAAASPTPTATSTPTATATPIGAAQTFAVGGHPGDIMLGADGNLWFTDGNVGRITPTGTVTEFTTNSAPANLTDGPDGNVWFEETAANIIGTVTTAGVLHEYTIPTKLALDPIFDSLTPGPDGNVWFVEYDNNQIGRVTPSGVITEFKLPTANNRPSSITKGPDGNLWFTERNAGTTSKIGRITPTGTVTEFPTDILDSAPADIIVGPDGNLWYTETDTLGRMTTTGAAKPFTPPLGFGSPTNLTVGPDGNVWYLDDSVSSIGSVTPTGGSRSYTAPAKFAGLVALISGPGGSLWFSETNAGVICKISPAGVIQQYPVRGAPGGLAVGPDGNVWYTDGSGYDIGRVTP